MTQLTNDERDAVVVALKALIAEISEYTYSSEWDSGIEDRLWREMQHPTQEWHGYSTDGDMLPMLRVLSELIGGWLSYDEGYVPVSAMRDDHESHATGD